MIFRKILKTDSLDIYNLQISTFNINECLSFENIEKLCINNSGICCINNDNELLGYILYGLADNLMNVDEMVITVLSVSINENFKRKNIATELFNRLIYMFEKYNIYLNVKINNISAINLYKKLGFKILTCIENYYDDNIDSYYMIY